VGPKRGRFFFFLSAAFLISESLAFLFFCFIMALPNQLPKETRVFPAASAAHGAGGFFRGTPSEKPQRAARALKRAPVKGEPGDGLKFP
jgi:hypothetical protein